MESAANSGNFRKLFQLIRVTGKAQPGVSETICEADGTPIHNLDRRLERWAEHFEGQFCSSVAPTTPQASSYHTEWSITTAPPTEAETLLELQNLKRHKASGADELPPAIFIDGGISLARELTHLFSLVWTEERVPPSWSESVIVPIFKKGSRSECVNHRGISLIPVVSKLLAAILLRRLSATREMQTREEQAGFRTGRGCIDQIFTLRQILELCHTYRRPTIVVFLDIRGAFDSVDRAALWNCLLRDGVPGKYVNILKALYLHTSGRVRAYGSLSRSLVVSNGVRQGCPISPFLFNFAIDDILQTALPGIQNLGIEVLSGSKLQDLEYADDIALLGNNVQAIQTALNRLAIEACRYGMHFAPPKCKVFVQDWMVPMPVLTIDGNVLEVVENFVYLGSTVSAGGDVGDEIDRRIAKARVAFANLRHLWRRRDIRLTLKGRVYNTTVRKVLLYGCETWPLRVEDVRRLSTFDHRCLRNIARVWWQQHVSDLSVRQRVLGSTDSRPISTIISQHQLRWLGHVLRMPAHRLPRQALYAEPGPGWKKACGGQKLTWRRGMKKLTSRLASVGPCRLPGWGARDAQSVWLDTLKDMAGNRGQWKSCCGFLCPP